MPVSDEQNPESSVQSQENQPTNQPVIPVVGIGASAGGLQPLEIFFSHMPPDSGMAFIVMQHTDPKHKSLMGGILANHTSMKIFEVTEQITLQPDCVYIIPRSRDAAVYDGIVYLIDANQSVASRMPIDTLLQSLAEDRQESAMGILLSGANTDGTLGLRTIKGYGGLTIVQTPESSDYTRMPQSAIDQGVADFILLPSEMPDRLIQFVKYGPSSDAGDQLANRQEYDSVQKIFSLLRSRTGHDFSAYKRTTISRRISRRMMIKQIDTISGYVEHLQQEPQEVTTLFTELLVSVTTFFRDTAVFNLLEKEVIPHIFESKRDSHHIRIWIAGCATGEEAYSVAMLCQEYMDSSDEEYKIQIFATDISDEAIQEARAGRYPANIASQISPARLQRFFARQDGSYIIHRQIRDMVTFAVQSLIKDPPFSNIDLVTCRNVLIYLEPELQRKLILLFHYVLNSKGYLVLGTSETPGEFVNLFLAVDRKWKIYQKLKPSNLLSLPFELPSKAKAKREVEPAKTHTNRAYTLSQTIEAMLLADYMAPCVIVNDQGDIVYLHRQTDKYLRPSTGEISVNILDMSREGLKLPLAAALRRIQMEDEDIFFKNILVKKNGDYHAIDLLVSRIKQPESLSGLILVMFNDIELIDGERTNLANIDPSAENAQRVIALEDELGSTKQYLQAVVEELEASNEELKSMNEELNASNEELQSANEELETATEELQSVNEELTTANVELEGKVIELMDSTNELNDLIYNIDIAIIFLDRKLNIRRFTPQVNRFINLINSDIGRPLSDMVSKFNYDGLLEDAQKVLDTLQPQRVEVSLGDNLWYWIRLKPYVTGEGAIVGVVITFIDITEQKHIQQDYQNLADNPHEQDQDGS